MSRQFTYKHLYIAGRKGESICFPKYFKIFVCCCLICDVCVPPHPSRLDWNWLPVTPDVSQSSQSWPMAQPGTEIMDAPPSRIRKTWLFQLNNYGAAIYCDGQLDQISNGNRLEHKPVRACNIASTRLSNNSKAWRYFIWECISIISIISRV